MYTSNSGSDFYKSQKLLHMRVIRFNPDKQYQSPFFNK